MKYDRILTHDFVNGEGMRVSLYVTGCHHGCPGCFNASDWNPNAGQPFTEDTLQELLKALDGHDGLSLLGGDPLYPRNRSEITRICKAVKEAHPTKDIWLWTGYTFKEVAGLPVMDYVDRVIDGKYREDLPTVKPWRGSDNQNMIIIKEINN